MRVSVFVTSYNQREYLTEAIDSVLGQTLPPVQIIVVDDASTDGSQDVIADYARRYSELFTPIYHKQNTGVAMARIDALNAVTGDYVTYVDGDDRFLPEKIQLEAGALSRNTEARIAFSNNWYVSSDGRERLRRWIDSERPPEGNVFWQTFARAFPKRSLFRMELVSYADWKRVGFHDPDLHLYEDFDMRIRLTKYLHAVYVDRPLSEIRLHGVGLSNSPPDVHLEALDRIYQKNAGLLDALRPEVRRAVRRGFGRLAGRIARRGARDAFHKHQYVDAFQFTARRFQYRWRLS